MSDRNRNRLVTFGDSPGHEFHGNQWTAGQAMGAATAANVAAHEVSGGQGKNPGKYASIHALSTTAKTIKSGSAADHRAAQAAHEEAARTHAFYANEHVGQDPVYQNHSDAMHRQALQNHTAVAAYHEQAATALETRGARARALAASAKHSVHGRNVVRVFRK